MANRLYNFVVQMISGTLAKAEDVNTNLSSIQTGFDDTATELDQAIQITSSPGTTHISLNAAARALKILTFDASGNVVAVDDMGNWQGNHAGATDYNERDIVKDAAGDIGLNNIYRANTSFTSSASMATDAAKWDKVIDVADVEAAKVAAELAETNADATLKDFETKYLGSKSSNPALDNEGNALIDGALYFNTAVNGLRVYDLGTTTWSSFQQADTPVLLDSKSASASATIDFTSSIDSTYDHYYIEFYNVVPSVTSDSFGARVSVAATFDSGSNYWVDDENEVAGITNRFELVPVSKNLSAVNPISGRMDFYMRNATIGSRWNARAERKYGAPGSALGNHGSVACNYSVNSVVDGIRFLFSTGNITAGEFKLFGVPK